MSKSNRSHPQSLRNQIKKVFNTSAYLKKNPHILLGVSGGSDSMALLHVLATLREECKFTLSVLSINHGLRTEAVQEVNLVKEFCDKLSVNFYSTTVDLGKEIGNIQERARNLRYEALRSLKQEIRADYIATAHHKNDRAETILMKILTGTCVSSLNTLPVLNNDLFRPMIGAYKSDVMLHIKRKDVPYMDDPSNKYVDKYLRSKVRYNIMPELEKINPNIADALCNLSDDSLNYK